MSDSTWRGHAHPEWHDNSGGDTAYCWAWMPDSVTYAQKAGCGNSCTAKTPCPCCAEVLVERIRAVRDVCKQQTVYPGGYADGWHSALDLVEQALDGSDE